MAQKQSARQSSKEKRLLINNPTVGADIEVFLQDKDTNAIVSAEGIIKGAKHAPFKFLEGDDFFATSLDNVMAEFCIPPAKTANDFKEYISYAISWINGFIPKNLQTLASPAARVDGRFLQTENAKLFGCEPDFNAWEWGDQNEKPCPTGDLRSCGGHIHIGYENPKGDTNLELIRIMDIFLGLPSILQEPDNERKSLYGKAGAFRHKTYGVEYRTISNYYVNSPRLMEWVYNNTLEAIDFVNKEQHITPEEGQAVRHAINSNDKKLADMLIGYYGVKLAA
jgi:hypothetical protein